MFGEKTTKYKLNTHYNTLGYRLLAEDFLRRFYIINEWQLYQMINEILNKLSREISAVSFPFLIQWKIRLM